MIKPAKLSLRDFKTAKKRREFLETQLKMNYSEASFGVSLRASSSANHSSSAKLARYSGSRINLDQVSDFNFSEKDVNGANIENLIGATQIPLGIAGPVTIHHPPSATRNYFIPLATTEGALLASVSRGAKAITLSGGSETYVKDLGMTRSPIFKTNSILESKKLENWIKKNFSKIQSAAEATSSHLQLTDVSFATTGRNLFVRFVYLTGEAMGMNMATIATQKAVEFISSGSGYECLTIAGNYDIDKKSAWLNFILGRGKRVWAEVVLKKEVLAQVLKTSALKMHEVVINKALIGSALSGSMGFNAQFSNIIAAIFLATGQDLGQIPESSMGIINTELLEGDDLYFSVYLPCLEIGILGGGTKLPSQSSALSILGVKTVLEFAQVIAAATLAGEISLIASQAQGSLAKAHIKLGRKGGSAYSR